MSLTNETSNLEFIKVSVVNILLKLEEVANSVAELSAIKKKATKKAPTTDVSTDAPSTEVSAPTTTPVVGAPTTEAPAAFKPSVEFPRLWKSDAQFRTTILNKFPKVKEAVDKAEVLGLDVKKTLAKQASAAWAVCKDKKSKECHEFVLSLLTSKSTVSVVDTSPELVSEKN